MIEVKNVVKTFDGFRALDGLTMTVPHGAVYGLVGPNGAGKSTMLNAVAGVWPVDMGKIIIDGKDITRLPEHKRAAYIGRVFQDPMMGTAATMQIDENLALAARRCALVLPKRKMPSTMSCLKPWAWAWRTA
mgnify:CR=1 FL=1